MSTVSQQDIARYLLIYLPPSRIHLTHIYTQLLQRTEIEEGMLVKYVIVTVAFTGSIEKDGSKGATYGGNYTTAI